MNAPTLIEQSNQGRIGLPGSGREIRNDCHRTIGLQTRRLLRNPMVCTTVAALAALLIAFLLTAFRGIPAPMVHDEFAYLLGADTFASGRVTNPTHPLWQHFESFHIIHQPSYTSKYPPAQSLMLALGQLLGHPIIGAFLTTGICVGALVWMLTGWIPRKYFWAAAVFGILHPGIQIVWGQSYWGGSLALTGAALLLGALGRMDHRMKIRWSVIAGIGVLLLANSRPFEGVILTAAVGVGLIWKLTSSENWRMAPFIARVILPAALFLACGFGLMASYNQNVTGHWSTLPYSLHESEYGWNPLFIWQSPGDKPSYRHPVMEGFYETDVANTQAKLATFGKVVQKKSRAAYAMTKFYCGGTILIALFGLPFVLRRPRYRFALLIAIPAGLAAISTPWDWAHYGAAASPVLMLLFIASMIEIWKHCRTTPILRTSFLIAVPLFHLIWFVLINHSYQQLIDLGWGSDRVAIENQLLDADGKDLVLVRYTKEHNTNAEWVYNKSNLDAAEVIWAREMSPIKRESLLNYFEDRNVWIVEADSKPPVLRRFDPAAESQNDIMLTTN